MRHLIWLLGPMRKARPRPGSLYWICQIGGWLSYALLCTFSSWLMEGHFYEYLTCSIVLAGCGLLITHLLRGFMKKRRWLDPPPARLISRVAAAIPVLGMIYVGCIYLTAPLYSYLLHKAGPFDIINQHPAYLFLDFVDSLFTFACWLGIYIGFHWLKEHRRAEKESWRLAVALSQARVDILRGPVNPHFLFKALKSLRGLIDARAPQAQDVVTRLASILRYSLSTDPNATVPFGTELNAVTDYLELELLRFEDRLSIHKQIQAEALDRPIPRMLLQALVENAVRYGASQNPGISELSIFAAIDPTDGRLCIRVYNTGHLRMDDSCSKGTGLRNARERLHRLFGNDAELKIAEDPPGRVSVAVSVPNRQPTVALPGSLEFPW
jgi:two-component system, LytTR family, sensor kinase